MGPVNFFVATSKKNTLYYHGHGALVDGNPCLLTPTWEAVPIDELVNKVADRRITDRLYVLTDCCANSKKFEDEATRKRVSDAVAVVKGKHFLESIVRIKAVPEGHEAMAIEGKTFTSALVDVLTLSKKSLPLHELQRRLRKKQEDQGSRNFPVVEASVDLANEPFPL